MVSILSRPQCVNSVWPSVAIWQHTYGSILSQVMACCLMAPSHYLNQYSLKHQWGLVPFTLGQFNRKYSRYLSKMWVWKLPHFTEAKELNHHSNGWLVRTTAQQTQYKQYILLTHWGRVTHICLSKLTIIGSDNGLSPGRRQAIIWTNARISLIGPLRRLVTK